MLKGYMTKNSLAYHDGKLVESGISLTHMWWKLTLDLIISWYLFKSMLTSRHNLYPLKQLNTGLSHLVTPDCESLYWRRHVVYSAFSSSFSERTAVEPSPIMKEQWIGSPSRENSFCSQFPGSWFLHPLEFSYFLIIWRPLWVWSVKSKTLLQRWCWS